jgi:hypothetical protein
LQGILGVLAPSQHRKSKTKGRPLNQHQYLLKRMLVAVLCRPNDSP